MTLAALVLGAGGAMLIGASQYRWVPVLAALVVASFALAAKRRVWLLAPLLLVEFTISNFVIEELGLTLRLAASLVAALLAVPFTLSALRTEDGARRRVIIWAATLTLMATVGNMLHSDEEYVFKYLRYQTVQIVVLLVTAYAVRSRRDLELITLFVLGIATLSAADAVWQHFDRSGALYGEATAQFVDRWKGRAIGLAQNPVLLANHLSLVWVTLLGVMLYRPLRIGGRNLALWIAAALIAGGLYFTYTRSAVYAVGLGLVAMGLFQERRRRNAVLALVLGGALLFQLLQGTGLIGSRYYRTASEDRSAATHEALWQVGLAIALDNWAIGIGHEDFEEVSSEYADDVEPSVGSAGPGAIIGNQRPHNDFLNVWLSWGIASLVAYCAMMLTALRNLVAAARSGSSVVRGLAVGGIGSLVTYAANSAFHNYFDSSVLLWAYCGLSIALARVAAAEPVQDWARHVSAFRDASARGARRAMRRAP